MAVLLGWPRRSSRTGRRWVRLKHRPATPQSRGMYGQSASQTPLGISGSRYWRCTLIDAWLHIHIRPAQASSRTVGSTLPPLCLQATTASLKHGAVPVRAVATSSGDRYEEPTRLSISQASGSRHPRRGGIGVSHSWEHGVVHKRVQGWLSPRTEDAEALADSCSGEGSGLHSVELGSPRVHL